LVLATAFTTQSEETALKQLKAVANTQSDAPIFVYNPPGSRIYQGEITTAYVLTGPGGVADPFNPQPRKILFTMFVPSTAPPPNGYPITIFGHGLTRSRSDFIAIINIVSSGQAVIATDAPFHGDRSWCTGSAAFLQSIGVCTNCTDDDACNDPVTQRCNPSTGRCIARISGNRASCDPGVTGGVPGDVYCSGRSPSQGFCLNETGVLVCEGGDFFRDSSNSPVISGWNLLNLTNFFATRDNFRQQVIDLAQLTRVIQAPGFNSLLTPPARIDRNNVNYIGQSLGGILGTLYTSVAPEIHRVVLNVPGASLPRILLTSPAFAPVRAQFLATLAAQNPPILPGSPAFDTFVGVAQWVLDPADPQNQALSLLNGTMLPTDRKVLIQSITGDQVIPNPTTDILIASVNRTTVPASPQADTCRFNPPGCAPDDRHGFLLNSRPGCDTPAAQTQAINYVNNPLPFTCP
jgi:pimeloyl-ACP methyl ester carboxylesterase